MSKESHNIKVTRIVGDFLEHSRIFYFHNGGNEEVMLGSADLMPRNLDHRVETLFPVEDEGLRKFVVHDVLGVYLKDNVKASVLNSDGQYVRRRPENGKPPFEAQAYLLSQSVMRDSGGDISSVISALPKKYRKHLTTYGRMNPHD